MGIGGDIDRLKHFQMLEAIDGFPCLIKSVSDPLSVWMALTKTPSTMIKVSRDITDYMGSRVKETYHGILELRLQDFCQYNKRNLIQ